MGKYENYDKDFKSIICKNIKRFRKESGMSILKVSELVDVTPEYFKRIESPNDQNKTCSLNMLYKLSLIFDKKLDDFLQEYDDENGNK